MKMVSSVFSRIIFELFLSFAFLKFSIADYTLRQNQTLSIGQTLVSPNKLFEFGFFTPEKSKNRFLGIWYESTPDIVVWVANRNNPIVDSEVVTFAVSGNGTLVISGGENIIWSANPSEPASNPVLQLLDTGNLVLNGGDKTKKAYIWQSFDYPTDTWIRGMKIVDDTDAGVEKYLTSWRNSVDPSPGDFVFKIENIGLPELVILRGKTKIYRGGKWNGLYFAGSQSFPNAIFNPPLVFRGDRLLSLLHPPDNSAVSRTTLDMSGLLQRYTMSPRKDSWINAGTFGNDRCDKYSYCGPNGICRIDKIERCECFKGFSPKSRVDWDLQDWSSGCTRNSPLNCQNEDDFLEVAGVKYPDMLEFWLNTSMSLAECRAECLKNCNCTACANPYITNGGTGCVMWFGDLVDTREITAPDSKQNIYIRLPKSEIDYVTNSDKKKKKKRHAMVLLISIPSGVLVLGLGGGGILLKKRKNRQASKNNNEDLELPLFKFATIMAATNNLCAENMIGEGGFGPVYKGNLSAGEEIAIKRLSKTSGQGLQEFKNEVILIAKLQHKNLVKLLGCCIEGEERMLIYEYMRNKSLDHFVFDKDRSKLLTWPKRFNIIMGIARGLLYLHHDSRLKIIHRDLKPSNILLDGNLNPKISDFGLARSFGEDQDIARTRRIVGTYGYMAPEYCFDGKFSEKSDIYSMGVILLEIVSGKRNRGVDHHSLLGQAWLSWKENKIMELLDDCLKYTCIQSQVKKCIQVGLLCVQKFAKDRPDMSLMLFMLGTDGAILPEPKKPGLFMESSSRSVSRRTFQYVEPDKGTITITDFEAR